MLKGKRAWLDEKARGTGLAQLAQYEGRRGLLIWLIVIGVAELVSGPDGVAEKPAELAWVPLGAFVAFLVARVLMRRIVRSHYTAPLQSPRPSPSPEC